MTVQDVDAVARGRVWTGADALERGFVDELGGLRTAIDRAKVLAGFDADTDVKLVSLPGSSFVEVLRPKPSSQPAAASLPRGGRFLGGPIGRGRSRAQTQRSLSGVNAPWLGDVRF